MAEGFRVARPITARAGSSSSARATPGWGAADLGTIGPIAGVEVHVALGYWPDTATVDRWDSGLWDSDTWALTAPPLVDVSCDVLAYSSQIGRDLPLERFRAGTAVVELDDPTGKYSPWRTAGDPRPIYNAIRPGLDVEVWVETGTGTYPRFTGRVTAIADLFPTLGRHAVRFECADYLSVLAGYDGFEQPAVGAGETSGPRISRICDSAGYDRPRAFDTGTRTLQATTLAKNALDEAGLVCDTELGVLFCDRDGTLVHRDVNGLVTDPEYTDVQAVFGEVDPEVCYSNLELASDTSKIKNLVSIAREGGSAMRVDEPASRALFGTLTFQRFDLIHENDADSQQIAQHHVDVFAFASDRIERLHVEPMARPDQLDQLLPLGLLSRIEVRRRAEGFQVVAELQIEGVREAITPTSWDLEYATFDASSVFDAGRWDTDLWDIGLWGY